MRSFGPRHVHDVRNSAAGSVAVSVHAYSPPLSAMTRYDLTPGGTGGDPDGRGGRLVTGQAGGARGPDHRRDPGGGACPACPAVAGGGARGGAAGARLIDIRPAAQRAAAGEIPGSVVIERNHLEWRLDPASDARLPWVTGYDLRPIVFCMEGYTSSLAASAFQDLGFAFATDVAGGYLAWQKAGSRRRSRGATVGIAPGASPPSALPRLVLRRRRERASAGRDARAASPAVRTMTMTMAMKMSPGPTWLAIAQDDAGEPVLVPRQPLGSDRVSARGLIRWAAGPATLEP